jgi:hypothetical protein
MPLCAELVWNGESLATAPIESLWLAGSAQLPIGFANCQWAMWPGPAMQARLITVRRCRQDSVGRKQVSGLGRDTLSER